MVIEGERETTRARATHQAIQAGTMLHLTGGVTGEGFGQIPYAGVERALYSAPSVYIKRNSDDFQVIISGDFS